MIAVDTNQLVRLATNDVPVEREAVVALLERNEALIPKTVFLETATLDRKLHRKASRIRGARVHLLKVRRS